MVVVVLVIVYGCVDGCVDVLLYCIDVLMCRWHCVDVC